MLATETWACPTTQNLSLRLFRIGLGMSPRSNFFIDRKHLTLLYQAADVDYEDPFRSRTAGYGASGRYLYQWSQQCSGNTP